MGRPDSILDQIGETARCRDAQHGGGVCCAFANHILFFSFYRVVIIVFAAYRTVNDDSQYGMHDTDTLISQDPHG